MEENKNEKITEEAAVEILTAVYERQTKRLFVLCILLLLILVGSNIAWIHYENSFEDSVTVMQDTPNGNNSYVGRDGSITYGETDNN